jgi:hypothetical protein
MAATTKRKIISSGDIIPGPPPLQELLPTTPVFSTPK